MEIVKRFRKLKIVERVKLVSFVKDKKGKKDRKIVKVTKVARVSKSFVETLPFDIILMISHMLKDEAILRFIKAFRDLPAFAPFLCLLKLKIGNDLDGHWTLIISSVLNPATCKLVQDAAFVSRSIDFYGSLENSLQTMKECGIREVQRVTLNLRALALIPSTRYDDFARIPMSNLHINHIETVDSAAAPNFATAVNQNLHLKNLAINLDSHYNQEDFLASIGILQNIKKLSCFAPKGSGMMPEECETLGKSLITTNITTFELYSSEWNEILLLSKYLIHSKIEKLRIQNCSQNTILEYCEGSPAQQILINISNSKVKHLTISGSKLQDEFVVLLAATKGLNLVSLDVSRNELSMTGMTALLKMKTASLIYLDIRRNMTVSNDSTMYEKSKEILIALRPPRLRLKI